VVGEREAVREGRTWVVDADIESFFDRLGFDLVLNCLRERISDRKVLKLIRMILGAGVLDGTSLSHPTEGSPQGGPLSPVLANVVLHRLDHAWQQQYRRLGTLIRYADDVCICCSPQQRAEAAMSALTEILAGLGLRLAPAKTRIVGVASGAEGYDFLVVPSSDGPVAATSEVPLSGVLAQCQGDDPGPLPHPGVDRAQPAPPVAPPAG
jgi:RNA-directed DNA polymerase